MVPNQSFFHGKFNIIRPLAFVDKSTVRRYSGEKKFPVFNNPCPTSKNSKRREIKLMLEQLYASNKKIKGNIFRAMSHVNTAYLLK
jgi:tRNA 2-thiocytidine biosynthesis protein TtcA